LRRNRFLVSLVTVALAALSIGTATAWFSDSATIRFEISAANDFGDDDGGKVWVCKLTGPPSSPSLKPGKNPIHVSVDSVDAEEGSSNEHPSYVVEHGDVVCTVPETGGPPESEDAPEPKTVETPDVEEPEPSDPTTTTTMVAETTATTGASTTTTTTVPAASTTTAPPEDPQTTTTTTVAQSDD
jgi:hypothetical protein